MINIAEKNKCCGCTGCKSVCPANCILMQKDEKGFLYPSVNEDKCINCGLCERVCNFKSFIATEHSPKTYAIRSKNKNEVASSRSGAIFIELSKWVLTREGIVFGCVLEDAKTIIHKWENTKEGVDKFKGSKYVQSSMGDCFKECVEFLRQGKWVLFSGTACQVHGLISFLDVKKIPKEKLLAVDIVCHGVPSPTVWGDYVDYWNKHAPQKGMEIVDVNFRNKGLFGWKDHKESFLWKNPTITTTTSTNWTNNFYAHTMFRDSCYECPYATPNRNTDFTIADYWGIERNAPQFDDNKGVSLLLVHTKKAEEILDEIKDETEYQETELSSSLQPNLLHPSHKGAKHDEFWKDYVSLSNERFMKKYFFPSKTNVFIKNVFNNAKKIIKKMIGRK